MAVNLSIKGAPEELVEKLKRRAKRHHRSLQGEMMVILEEAVRAPDRLTVDQVLAEVRRIGVATPAEAAAMIRSDRDGR
jgi:antitoxin FitA